MTTSRKPRRLTVTQVAERLRLMILDGELAPGTRLRQAHLAEKFGVSVNAVREALMELKGGGWVEGMHYQGITVARPDGRLFLDTLEVREVLEGLAARLCCRRVTREQTDELRELVAKMYAVSVEGGPDADREELALDREFHARLARLSGNRALAALAAAHRAMGPANPTPPEEHARTRDEHLAVVDAIEAGRAADAERLMREHVAGLRPRRD